MGRGPGRGVLSGAETGLASPVGSDVGCGGTVWGRWCLAQGVGQAVGPYTCTRSDHRRVQPEAVWAHPCLSQGQGGDCSTVWSDPGRLSGPRSQLGPGRVQQRAGLTGVCRLFPDWGCGSKEKGGGRKGRREIDRQGERG